MDLHQFLDQGQADAAALVRARLGLPDLLEPVEDARQFLGGDAYARVAHREFREAVTRDQLDANRPVQRELEGVREQVEDDLFPHGAVDEHRSIELGRDRQRQPRPLERRAEHRGEFARRRTEVRRNETGLVAPRLDPRKIEQRVDELEQAKRIASGDVDERKLSAFDFAGEGFQRSEHERQRGAELVADVVEEARFRRIELGERLGALANVALA